MENPFKAVMQFIIDIIIFWLKAFFYTLESLYYTLMPNRLRKLKVRHNFPGKTRIAYVNVAQR